MFQDLDYVGFLTLRRLYFILHDSQSRSTVLRKFTIDEEKIKQNLEPWTGASRQSGKGIQNKYFLIINKEVFVSTVREIKRNQGVPENVNYLGPTGYRKGGLSLYQPSSVVE